MNGLCAGNGDSEGEEQQMARWARRLGAVILVLGMTTAWSSAASADVYQDPYGLAVVTTEGEDTDLRVVGVSNGGDVTNSNVAITTTGDTSGTVGATGTGTSYSAR